VRLDGTNLYTQYPVGRRIYIKLKDLYIGDYARLIQIGGGIDNSDPARPDLMPLAPGLFDKYIVKGRTGNTVTPKVVTVAQLADSLQSMLIQLNNMEFQPSDTSATYADAVTRASRNLTVRSCSGSSIIIRSSGYSNFAGVNVPNGNGTLLAIYTIFNATKQLVIRDTSDVQFSGPRCGAGPTTQINIADVRALFNGTTVSVPDGRRITGIVISDRTTSNLVDQNVVLQQGNGQPGIVVRFDAAHNFNLGDSIDVNISQQQLSEFNGLLQVSVPLGFATLRATGKSITPRVATAKQVVDSAERWESTLVRINNATLTGGTGGNYSGTVNINDGSGTSLAMFTRSQASFSGQAYPANASSITGYVGQFNTTYQLSIRGASDVVSGSVTPPPPVGGPDLIISEYVEGSSNNKYLEIYNAGTTTVNLNQYVVRLYTNGSTTASNSVRLDTLAGLPSTTLAPGGIIVLRNSAAALTLPAGVTSYVSNVTNFNGDDVVEIEKNGVVIDVFGERGVDPGTSWTIAGDANAAVDKSVRRNASITQGSTNWTTSAATQWTVISTLNDVSNLGTR
jgi:hypothetical protein